MKFFTFHFIETVTVIRIGGRDENEIPNSLISS